MYNLHELNLLYIQLLSIQLSLQHGDIDAR